MIGFVGRFVRDKGIEELVEATRRLQASRDDVSLLLVGDFEEGDPVSDDVRVTLAALPRVVHVGFVKDPAAYYRVMDVFALPTHREGFPNVPLEAAAAGRPVVASDATGARDAVVDGETGLLFPVGDVGALTQALARVLDDQPLAARFGAAGAARVRRDFASERIWTELDAIYTELWDAHQRGEPRAPARTNFRGRPDRPLSARPR